MSLETSLDWYKAIKGTETYDVESAKIDFACMLDKQLRHQDMQKREFAAKLNTSAAYITKVLSGEANLTIESMVKLARAANCELHIHLSLNTSNARWVEVIGGNRKKEDQDAANAWASQAVNGKMYEPIAISA